MNEITNPIGSPLRRAIAAIMAEVGAVSKGGRNTHQNYNYAAIEDVSAALQPLLAKHGVIIVPDIASREIVQNSILVLDVDFHVSHVSGECLTKLDHEGREVPLVPRYPGAASFINSKGGVDDKAFNKAVTAASKYFDIRLFKIPTVMPDADNDPDQPAAPRAAPANVSPLEPQREQAKPHDGPPRNLPIGDPSLWPQVLNWTASLAATIKAAEPKEAAEWTKLNGAEIKILEERYPMAYRRLKEHIDAKVLPSARESAPQIPEALSKAFAVCRTKRALDTVWQTQVADQFDDPTLEAITQEFQKHEARIGARKAV